MGSDNNGLTCVEPVKRKVLRVSFCGREMIMNCFAILHDHRYVTATYSPASVSACQTAVTLWLKRFGQRIAFLLCVCLCSCDVKVMVSILLHLHCTSTWNQWNVFAGIRMAHSPFLLQLISVVFMWYCKYDCSNSLMTALQIQYFLFPHYIPLFFALRIWIT